MVTKQYIVKLPSEERDELEGLFSSGEEKVRKLVRARILLKADEGWADKAICNALDVGRATVERIRRRFVEEGLQAALNRRASTRQYERLLDGKAEAHLIALACSAPPEGRKHWSMRMLANRSVTLEQLDIDSVSHETVRQVLKKTSSNLGSKSNG